MGAEQLEVDRVAGFHPGEEITVGDFDMQLSGLGTRVLIVGPLAFKLEKGLRVLQAKKSPVLQVIWRKSCELVQESTGDPDILVQALFCIGCLTSCSDKKRQKQMRSVVNMEQ